jgi:leader peptidase (prepilin peptidase) / N-methyltransferase
MTMIAPETLYALVTGMLGLAVGSFLNVVIVRVPAGESVVRPPSHCRCGARIAPRDNVPVLSWLVLRGTARCCSARISARYPVVEALTGAAFLGVAWWWLARQDGTAWALPALLYLVALSICLAAIDLATFRLPFWIVAPSYPVAAALLGIAGWAAGEASSVVRMLIGGVVAWSLYRLLHLIHPRGMGYGDVRLSGVLGMYLGWLGWSQLAVGLFMGFLVGGVAGIVLIASGRGKLKTAIPYGPYLLLGAWIGVLAGAAIGGWYLDSMGL